MIIPVFDRVENIVGNGKKMLINSIFSYSLNVFKRLLLQLFPRSSLQPHWRDFTFLLQFNVTAPVNRTYPLQLTLPLTTNIRLFQTERVCRQISNSMKMLKSSPKG